MLAWWPMSEISLYRKYRPQTFGHLVGQDHVRITLMNAVRTDKLAHAYLFTGPRGTGKTSTARLFAKAINCEDISEAGEPCEKCDICIDITSGRLIDVIEIDAASHTGVDDVRELIDKLHFAPTRARNKVYIVDEVHMLSKGAFNAFLKTLEEPPANVYFILATTEAHKVPETIISRCQRFDFKRIDVKTVMARLAYIAQSENIVAEEEALEMIAHHVDGGLRDAIGLFEQLIVDGKLAAAHVRTILGVAGSSAVEKFYSLLMSKDSVETLRFIQELYGEGVDFGQFTKELLEKMRLEMLRAIDTKKVDEAKECVRMIECFQKAFDQLRNSLIVQLPLEMAVVRFLHGEIAVAPVVMAVAPVIQAVAPPQYTMPSISTPTVEQKISSYKMPTAAPVSTDAAPEKVMSGKTITQDELTKNWPRVIERIKTPKLRISLKDVKHFNVEGYVITLSFSAKFHQDTVMDSAIRSELEKLIEEVFGTSVRVESRIERIELHTSIERHEETVSRSQAVSSDTTDFADDVAAMFGGEVVE